MHKHSPAKYYLDYKKGERPLTIYHNAISGAVVAGGAILFGLYVFVWLVN